MRIFFLIICFFYSINTFAGVHIFGDSAIEQWIGLIFFLAFFGGAFISRDPKTYIFMFVFVCVLVILAFALLSHIS